MAKAGSMLLHGLHHFWQTGLFSDVVVNTGQNLFKTHKVILSSYSPVFQAMFTADMKESTMDQVHFDTPFPDIFEMVLQFMYNGKRKFSL